jgi:hypothetical protein
MAIAFPPNRLVRMSPSCKVRMLGKCLPGNHEDGFSIEDCINCSMGHIDEFGDCVGLIEGFVDFNDVDREHPDWLPNRVGPEVNVRWQPSNLRYAYHPEDLDWVED